MASADIDWLNWLKWGTPIVFYAGATWAAYKQLVKSQQKDSARIDRLERVVANGVRPEDIKLVRADISELRKDLRAVLGAKE